MAPTLNPAAPVWLPTWLTADPYGMDDEQLTPQEMEELQMCEQWCELMADCEDAEHDHLVELALRHAPAQKLTEIEKRAHTFMRERGHAGYAGPSRRAGASKQVRQGRVRASGALFQPQQRVNN